MKTRGKVNYEESVIPARCQIIVESHPQIWGGGGLHALEMCLVQGYLMTALDALPLGFLRCTPIQERKKKRTLRSHRA